MAEPTEILMAANIPPEMDGSIRSSIKMMPSRDPEKKPIGLLDVVESEESEEFNSAVDSDNPTRHGEEYDYLEYLGEVNHVASGGSASTVWLDSPILAKFRSPMDNTALHLAALHGSDAMVDQVATLCPDLLFSCNVNGDTPLHVAARAGHISTLRKLMDACASSRVTRLLKLMQVKNNQGNIMLHEAIMSGGTMASRIFHVLEACSAAVEASGRPMETRDAIKPLSKSCYELALNNVNNQVQSVLYLAVEAGLMEAVNRILENCPESATPKGRSPLVAAIMKRDKGMVSIIVSKKKDWMHLRDKNGRLPLHRAASIGYHELVVHLLDNCRTCSIEKDKYGSLPLHLAARGGHVEVVKELLQYCPDPNEMVDQELRNILHIAAQSGKLDVVRYILQTPTLEEMINQKDKFGRTPLHLATSMCRSKIVYDLTWDDRVDLNMVNGENQTAFDLARKRRMLNPSSLRALLVYFALQSAGAKGSASKAQRSSKTAPEVSREQLDMIETAPDKSPKVDKEQIDKIKSGTVDSLSVISTLIVTASVAACLAVPGEAQGTAHNLHKAMFHFFILCITISFFSSISATIILLWVRVGSMELLNFAAELALPLLGAALVTLSLAFLAGIYTVISKLTWLATIFVLMSLFFVVILCVLYALVYLPVPSTRKIWRSISYYPFIFHAWLAEK